MEPIEHRCRFTSDGVEVCDEVNLRLDAVAQADELGLPHAGMDRAIDLHLKSLDLRDRDDAR